MRFVRLVGCLLAFAAAGVPAAAFAVPSYASRDISLFGRITSFDGLYAMRLRGTRGHDEALRLQHGTIINPRGRRLRPGMPVSVRAIRREGVLLAIAIDDMTEAIAQQQWRATLARYHRAEFQRAATAADRLAAKLERLYGKRIAAVPRRTNVVAMTAHAPTRVKTVHHRKHRPLLVARSARPVVLFTREPEVVTPTWYGWGKL